MKIVKTEKAKMKKSQPRHYSTNDSDWSSFDYVVLCHCPRCDLFLSKLQKLIKEQQIDLSN